LLRTVPERGVYLELVDLCVVVAVVVALFMGLSSGDGSRFLVADLKA
jgi:hypothetical protein